MGRMETKVCLDTSVGIDLMKKGDKDALSSVLTADAFLSSVTLFELMLRMRNLEEAELFVGAFEVLAFDEKAARLAFGIEKDLKRRGSLIGREDIFIAATAIVNDCALATLKVRNFSKIRGLKLVKWRSKHGYKKWREKTGYGFRWPATEGIFSAVKAVFGEELHAQSENGLIQEAGLKFWVHQKLKRYGEA